MTNEITGLSAAEVRERQAAGLANHTNDKTSRTLGEIIRDNVLTRFNALLSVLFVVVLFVGEPVDALFFIAIIINSAMGIAQELRAKITLDRLSILTVPRVRVRRDNVEVEIDSAEVVQDDLVQVTSGDQVPTDGKVISTNGVEIDESLLTGEADPVSKKAGDTVLSGAIVVSGSCWYQATAVGEQAYAHKLAAEVKRFSKMRSELMEGTNRLLGYIGIAIVVVAPLLIWGQIVHSGADLRQALLYSVAAIVGMIPEGLVVLTSFAFVLASISLARRKVLVQELPAVEGLARVDVICLDKTGTLTEGTITFDRVEMLAKDKNVDAALASFAMTGESPTLLALRETYTKGVHSITKSIPFSSARKWSAYEFEGIGTWVMGAPEMVIPDASTPARKAADSIAATGARVLLLARAGGALGKSTLPSKLTPVALVILAEKIRPDARETLEYFATQGVDIKVISGDNPRTVAAVAKAVGLGDIEPYDARNLPTDEDEVADVIEKHTVFGRVLPEQKQLFVRALQSRGHVVAMTGDGVNDALALKTADIGVAMGSGAPATRAVARLVLLDNSFAHLPHVLAEGRRVIANIERVANLFVIKNVYNLLFAIGVTVLALSFPFLPRQASIISWLTIGIPAFFLALAPNNRRYVPGFLKRVLSFAIPVGTVIMVSALTTYYLVFTQSHHRIQAGSAAVVCVVAIGLWVLVCLARPLRAWKLGLIGAMAAIFVSVSVWKPLARLLSFDVQWPYALWALWIAMIGAVLIEVIWRLGPAKSHDA